MTASRRLLSVHLQPQPSEHDDHDRLHQLAHDAQTSESAFDRLARAVRERVLLWAHSATGDRDEAEDVAQLVLLRLRGSDTFAGRGSFLGWLHRVTRNITLDRQRTARRRQLLLQAMERDAARAEFPAHDADTPALAPLVRAFLDELTPRQQMVIELIDLRRLETARVAEQLGISASTVRVLLAQGRRRLRLRLLSEHPDLLEEYRS